MKRGDDVRIDFIDHAEDTDDVIRFSVHGRIVSITEAKITVDCWHYAKGRYAYDDNIKRYSISRGSIERILIFEAEEVIE